MQALLDEGYEYYVWSIRLNGWWGAGSVYTSDLKSARPFKEAEMVKFCKAHYAPGGGMSAVPVRIADLMKVMV